jgi:hypothetical protein
MRLISSALTGTAIFGRRRRRRGPATGDEIDQGHVGLMADRGDQLDQARGSGAHHDLLVERPQILDRAAAARDNEEVGPRDGGALRQALPGQPEASTSASCPRRSTRRCDSTTIASSGRGVTLHHCADARPGDRCTCRHLPNQPRCSPVQRQSDNPGGTHGEPQRTLTVPYRPVPPASTRHDAPTQPPLLITVHTTANSSTDNHEPSSTIRVATTNQAPVPPERTMTAHDLRVSDNDPRKSISLLVQLGRSLKQPYNVVATFRLTH